MYGDIILQLIREFQRKFPRNLRHSVGMLKITKRNQNVRFSFAISGHAWRRLTVNGQPVSVKVYHQQNEE